MLKNLHLKKLILLLLTLSIIFSTTSNLTYAKDNKLSFMYLYGGTTQKYLEQINKTNNSVNVVSPNYFQLTDDGNLKTTVDPKLITNMHDQGIKVVPFLSNHWDQKSAQNALKNSEKLADDILNKLLKYNLDGINVDLENLTPNDKDQLTYFVSLLKEKLAPHNLSVSIAVGAIDSSTKYGWKAAYDLAKLSKYADYIIVMAYDQHWRTSGPGPVASLNWTQKNIEYMLKYIPKDKFVLSVPFYGRIWANGSNGGGINYITTIRAAEDHKATIKWHDEYQVPYVSYTKRDGVYKEIWFENYYSLKLKINLANVYDLKGIAAWRLGQEDTSIWKDYKNWLAISHSNFLDTDEHWAVGDINYLSERNLIAGVDKNHFAPDKPITRAEAVVILDRICNFKNTTKNPFYDVPNNYWAHDSILKAYNNDIIKGISKNQFGPDKNLTRAQLAVILERSFNLKEPNVKTQDFLDVPSKYWAYDEISLLKKYGFISGRTANKFFPDTSVTRAEFSSMVKRIIV